LRYFKKNGWEATVLAIDPKFVEAKADEELVRTIPECQEVIRTSAVPYQWTRRMGFGGIAWRAYGSIAREGSKLLHQRQYHAVYFSSTVFRTFCLGPKWLERFGVPYFIDYHDPWWTDYYFKEGAPQPPGGMTKYRVTQWLARKNEGRVIRGAAGVTCVSGGYVELLRNRYPRVDHGKFIEIPFGAPEKDFEKIGDTQGEQALVGSKPKEKWTYIGAGGAIMETAVTVFAETLSSMVVAKSVRPEGVNLQIAGTTYATYGKPKATLWPIIHKAVPGLQGEECVERLGYMETLRKLLATERLILFGTDDPGYTASKLFTYILAKRPLLVICREESSVARIVRETKAGELITFGEEEVRLGGRIRIRPEWKQAMGRWLAMDIAKEPPTDWKAFEPYTAKRMTEKLCRFFDEKLEAESRKAEKIENRTWEIGGAAGNRKREAGRELKTDRPKVLLVHPGVQHAPRLAEALEREGLLERFWTGWAKAGFGGGKRNVEIPKKKLRTRRWVEWVALALSRSGIDPETVWHWRNRIFQDLIPESEIEAADVVVGFDTGSWILAQRAKRLGKKFILDQSIGHPAARIPEMAKMGRAEETWREPYQPRPGRLANWEKVEHELADRIVVGSQFAKNTLIGQGVPAEKIRILPYGVGKEFVAAGEKRARDGKEGKIRFLFLGQLTQRKGMQFLLEAWKDLPSGKAELVLMGGGQRWGWKKQAGAGVTFIGQASRDRVLEEMGRSDVLVLPSLFEGFGLVILEAMAAGLTVIATQNTGGPDVIGEGKEGFVVPAGDAEALREKMEWFIQNPEKANEMGRAAHRKAKEYTWEKYGAEYARIIREVVKS
jgi:hypothetical protein